MLRLLALRQRQLLAALQTRGHAAVEAIRLETPEDKQWREGKLPEALRKARAHPEWSSLNGRRVGGSDRQEQIDALAELLESGRGNDRLGDDRPRGRPMPFVSYAQNLEDVRLWRALKLFPRGSTSTSAPTTRGSTRSPWRSTSAAGAASTSNRCPTCTASWSGNGRKTST